MTDLYSVQEAIEQQCRAETALRFENELSQKTQDGAQSATYFGSPLLKRAIEPTAELIKAKIAESSKGKAGHRSISFKLPTQLKPEVDA